MAYVKKTWKARQGVGLNKYTDSISGQTFALMNTPDSISQIGDAFTVANMNDLENRIDAGKVDKITGKGLSTNDYTDEDKAKLANSAALQASTAAINDLTVSITYIRSGSRAIVYIADMVPTGTGGSTITLPAELQGYTNISGRTAGGYGGGTVWQTGNPKNIYLIGNDANGKTLSIMGQGAMPVTVSNYTIIAAWCMLNY